MTHVKRCWLFSACVLTIFALAAASWGATSSRQYHIQTDEGPERYFRFQTDNGQFRKEKRLQDGTVIGTEAWIDANGFLRKKDYIADSAGYRILNSLTVHVGLGKNIEESIKSLKSSSSSKKSAAANLVQPLANGHIYTTARPVYNKANAVDSSGGKLNYLSPVEAAKLKPTGQLGFDHYPDELPRKYAQQLRKKLNNGYSPIFSRIRATTARYPSNSDVPVLSILPPFKDREHIKPIGVFNAAAATPINGNDAFEQAQQSGFSSPAPFTRAEPQLTHADVHVPNTLLLPPLRSTGDVLLQRTRDHSIQSNAIDATEYDTASSKRAGFRYVLPNQYHEELQIDSQKRAGSYGYVDPFGIRRVVYYNASPSGGFVHRNNNQYVGLGARPYDAPGPDLPDQR